MKIRSLLLVLALVLSFPLSLHAQERQFDMKLENLWTEYADCSAYYFLVSDALVKSGKAESAQTYLKVQENALMMAFAIASQQREQKMAAKVVGLTFDQTKNKMLKDINYRYENMVILNHEYLERCKDCMNSPNPKAVKAVNDLTKKAQ